MAVKTKDDEDVLAPVARATPEKSEGGPTPDDSAWLETFLVAAKGHSPSTAPYDQGSIVLVQFDRQQVRPCVIVTDANSVQESDIYGIVPLAPPLSRPIGGLTPSFDEREGGLPVSSTALCTHVRTVEPTQVVGYVGQLDGRKLKRIKNVLGELFTLGSAPDGRSVRR